MKLILPNLSSLCYLLSLCSLLACTPKPSGPPTDLTQAALLPYPSMISADSSRFVLQADTKIVFTGDSPELVATQLQSAIETVTGLRLKIDQNITAQAPRNAILLGTSTELAGISSPEGYQILIEEDRISLSASAAAGLFYGVQSLQQLIKMDSLSKSQQAWEIPTGRISDEPNYAYRGAMLDVSRHFFQVEDVKRYIELISHYKINYLHLHLADDQGWRVEIKSWPRLTEIGGSTQVGGGTGGFYTQEDYREIVRHAQAYHVTIVPEIDMPGHTNAALASYPELNCNGVSPALYTGTRVGFSTLCTSKEIVYQFVDDVVREISEMTPGPYFHVGGDESHVTPLEDYIPFIERVQGIVTSHGKRLIGWDEVAHAKLSEGAVVQYWAEAKNALRGVAQGTQVLLSPAKKVYLDMQYDSTTELGLHWAAYIEVDSAYLWSPETLVPGLTKENILGIESPLWSETVTTIDEIEYMVFPRLLGHAELGWSPIAVRDWVSYRLRLKEQGKRMTARGIDFYRSELVDWE